MGCSGSKQKKLDLSSSSSASASNTNKSNRKAPAKVKQSLLSGQAKSKQIQAKRASAAPLIIDNKNGSEIDGNKVTIQRSVSPFPIKPQKQQHQQQELQQPTIECVKSTQSATTRTTGWTDEQLLSQLQSLDFDTSSNIVRLFDEGNTIPFMCRYRRELIDNLDADK